MSKSKNFLQFDQIEQKLVFRVSRTFFWIFVAIAGLTFVAALFVLLYSFIPPSKKDVVKEQYPNKPTITLEEIQTAITPKSATPKYEEKNTDVVQSENKEEYTYVETIDSLQLKIDALVDSIGTYVKSGWGITYENYIIGYDWFGRPSYGTRTKRGLRSDLIKVLNEYYETKQEKIQTLEFMLNVMKNVPADRRETALRYFIRTTKDKWNEYRSVIDRIDSEYSYNIAIAETEYVREKLEKSELGNKSLLSIGSAIVMIALLGLILCFLAIERNTRSVKELLEREKKAELK